MTLVNNGRKVIATALASQITTGGMGTNNTAESESDTGLNGNVNLATSGTSVATSATVYDKMAVFAYTLTFGSGNGASYYEFGLNDGTYLFNRVTFPAFAKTSSIQLTISTSVRVN